MDSSDTSDDLAHDYPPLFKAYKDGRFVRYQPIGFVPPEPENPTGIRSKDVVLSTDTGLKARIFMPSGIPPERKLPLFVHYHGGAFCIGSALDSSTHTFLTALVSRAGIVAVSIDYRLAPEHPLPIAYDDSWIGLQWIASHFDGKGSEQWLNEQVDFNRVFLGGESAGANLAHYMAIRAGISDVQRITILGIVLIHPYFRKGLDDLIEYLYQGNPGWEEEDVSLDPNIKDMVGNKVLVLLAEKDFLKDRGLWYKEAMERRQWKGKLEIYETPDENHCFHLFNPDCENAKEMVTKIVDFINQN